MRVLGVDPGTWKAGIAVVDYDRGKLTAVHYETLDLRAKSSTKNAATIEKRLKRIHDELSQVVKTYKPDVMAIEDIFYGLNFRSAVRIGEARAVAILAATNYDVKVAEYLPTKVKKAVTGNGRASKVQVQFMVRHLLALRENPKQDSADALAVAICHCNTNRHV